MTGDPGQGRSSATVCVVGGGLSGLVAARELRRSGVDVLVLEAADRLGGRAMSETTLLGSRVDLGGQWVGHDHHRLKMLAAESDVDEFRMHTTLAPVMIDSSRRLKALSPSVLVAVLALCVMSILFRLSDTARWKSVTGRTWLDRVPGRTARRLLEVAAQISWTGDVDEISVHAMACWIRQQGGLRTMLTTAGGAQDALLVDGLGAVIDAVEADLDGAILLGHRVIALRQSDDCVLIETARGDIRCERAIVTVPVPLLRDIEFEPPLGDARATMVDTTYMGSVYKAIAVFDRPFWRDRCGGEFVVLDEPGRVVFDTSPPNGPGHLCILVGGRDARRLDDLDPPTRRDVLLSPLAPHAGDGVLQPLGWHEKSWHLDEFVGGGYMVLPHVGTTAGMPPLSAEPFGRIHWAGSETAADHPGYLDGAIESGMRAAGEVRRTLVSRHSPDE